MDFFEAWNEEIPLAYHVPRQNEKRAELQRPALMRITYN